MKRFRWFALSVICLGLSIGTTGCGIKKQVRYKSGPPNVAVSARTLHHVPEPQSAQVTFSHDTQYIQLNSHE